MSTPEIHNHKLSKMGSKYLLLGLINGVLVLLAGFVFLLNWNLTPIVKAGSSQNVSGWAWSENIGWISFNSTDGGGGADYGVNISQGGLFSGYAWSENVGWISFSPAGPYPSTPDYSARVNLDNGEASGWARALSSGGGWDGWIKLTKALGDGGSDYGVFLNFETKEFEGWAWGSEVVGWVSFNCKDGGNCLVSNYKALSSFNSPPTAADLLVSQGDYCEPFSALRPIFSWTFSDPDPDDTQGAYRIQGDNNNDFLSSEILSGKIFSSSTAYSPTSPLNYNTTYWWRIMVWDNQDATSTHWIYPTSTPGFPTPKPGEPLETSVHAYPQPNFEWLPTQPSQGEFIQFCSTKPAEGACSTTVNVSKCYDEAQEEISCSGNEFLWTFPDETSTTTENPRVKFSLKGKNQSVFLQIADDIGVCTTTKQFNISSPLPKWKEIPPQ